ncbi:MAG: site-2 protease family protein [Sphingobacteriales bacterium]|nr:MAG: site-2 protease family protein [Sphingobacteriales bacterium]
MGGSLNIGKLAGIKILVHWTFLILIAYIVFNGFSAGNNITEITFHILLVLAVFACVVLHELGHALAARRYGIGTKDITLLPIGGVASLESIPEKPQQELIVAIAGPLVNVVIALVLSFIAFIFIDQTGLSPENIEETLIHPNINTFIVSLIMVNIMLVLFNAIPAFPMDGGRVLRSLLAMTMDRVKATSIAAKIGQFIAILFVLGGLFYVKNPFLILIGVFVFLGAAAEAQSVTTGSILTGFKVRDVIRSKFTILKSTDTLKNAVDELLAGSDQDFLVSENNTISGILKRKDLIKALSENDNNTPIAGFINSNLPVLKPDDDIKGIYSMMQQNGFSLLPVLNDDGNLIGVLDIENLTEFVMIRTAIISQA